MSGNAYQSAIKAGYSEKYAKARSSELLENVGIKTYIEAQVEKIQSEKVLTATEALSILSDIARGKREEEVLMMNPVTGEVSRVFKKPDNNTVIKAIVEILKRYPTSKQAEKMQLEIDKLKLQVGGDEGQDDKISNLMNKIKEAISDEPI
ncbi:terminase small subunit [Streptococcus uberis]